MIGIGVIGYGYWGPNIVRNFQGVDMGCVKAVCDRNPRTLECAKKSYPLIETTTDSNELISRPDIEAVAVITPVATHYPLVKQALENGKHVFVEKPFTNSVVTKDIPPNAIVAGNPARLLRHLTD